MLNSGLPILAVSVDPEEPCPGLHVASWGRPPRVILGGITDTRPGQHEASWVRGPGLHVASWSPLLSWEPGSSVLEAFWDLARPTTVEDLVRVTVFTSVVSASVTSDPVASRFHRVVGGF